MPSDEWNCSVCTFRHLFPAQRCQMCNSLRVTKQQMRDFVQGKPVDVSKNGTSSSHTGQSQTATNTQISNARNSNQNASKNTANVYTNQRKNNNSNSVDTNNIERQRGDNVNNGGFHRQQNQTIATNTTRITPSSEPQKKSQQSIISNPYATNKSAVSVPKGNNLLAKNARNNAVNANESQARNIIQTTNATGQNNNNMRGGQPARTSNYRGNSNVVTSSTTVNPYLNRSGSQRMNQSNATLGNQGANNANRQANQLNPYSTNPFRNTSTSNSRTSNPYLNQQHSSSSNIQLGNNIQPVQQTNVETQKAISKKKPAKRKPTPRTSVDRNQQTLTLGNPHVVERNVPHRRYEPGKVPLVEGDASKTWIYPTSTKYEERAYQVNICNTAIHNNTLVAIPTGTGKTLIAAVVMYNFYRWFPTGKIIFLAPTKPLVSQQIGACYNIMGIPETDTAEITGENKSENRSRLWRERRVFFCTAQTVERDIKAGSLDINDVVCLVIDEAHKATKKFAFNKITSLFLEKEVKARIVGLSATPGKSLETIQTIISNLGASKIEAYVDTDEEIKPYMFNRTEEVIIIAKTDAMKEIDKLLLKVIEPVVTELKGYGVLRHHRGLISTMSAYTVIKQTTDLKNPENMRPNKAMLFPRLNVAQALLAARDQLMQSGINSAREGLVNFMKLSTAYAKQVQATPDFIKLWETLVGTQNVNKPHSQDDIYDLQLNNPKLKKLEEILKQHFLRAEAIKEDTRVIVFSNLRKSVTEIVKMLQASRPISSKSRLKATEFVGQGSGSEKNKDGKKNLTKGMNQATQQQVIKEFKDGKYNILVCTSIGEEGLDIGSVDLIINFDCVRSPIRNLQRIGRTGRSRDGRVVWLVMEGMEEKKLNGSNHDAKRLWNALKKGEKQFKMFKSIPLLPSRPKMEKRNMNIIREYRISQIGGHSHQKEKGHKKEPPRIQIDANAWKLSFKENHTRLQNFGECNINPAFRKSALKSWQRNVLAGNRNTRGTGRSCSILNKLEATVMKGRKTNEKSRTMNEKTQNPRNINARMKDIVPSNQRNMKRNLLGKFRDCFESPDRSEEVQNDKPEDDVEVLLLSPTGKSNLAGDSKDHDYVYGEDEFSNVVFGSQESIGCAVLESPTKNCTTSFDDTLSSIFGVVTTDEVHEYRLQAKASEIIFGLQDKGNSTGVHLDTNATNPEFCNESDLGHESPQFVEDIQSSSDDEKSSNDVEISTKEDETMYTSIAALHCDESPKVIKSINSRASNHSPNQGPVEPQSESLNVPYPLKSTKENVMTQEDTNMNDNASCSESSRSLNFEINMSSSDEEESICFDLNIEDSSSSSSEDDESCKGHGNSPKIDLIARIDQLDAYSSPQKNTLVNNNPELQKLLPLNNSDDKNSSMKEATNCSCSTTKPSSTRAHEDNPDTPNVSYLREPKDTKFIKAMNNPSKCSDEIIPQVDTFQSENGTQEASDVDETPIVNRRRLASKKTNVSFSSSQEETPFLSRFKKPATTSATAAELTDTPMTAEHKMENETSQLEDTPESKTNSSKRVMTRKRKGDACEIDLTNTPASEQKKLLQSSSSTDPKVQVGTKKNRVEALAKRHKKSKSISKFLDIECAASDSDSEEEDDDNGLSQDSFINDSSQLGFTQDALDRLVCRDSAQKSSDHGSASLYRQVDMMHAHEDAFATPLLKRRNPEHTQMSIPSSDRNLGKMSFIRSVIEHHREGGDADELEQGYHEIMKQNTSLKSSQVSATTQQEEPPQHRNITAENNQKKDTQVRNPKPPVPQNNSKLTEAQRERMRLNREKALRIRQQRIAKGK